MPPAPSFLVSPGEHAGRTETSQTRNGMFGSVIRFGQGSPFSYLRPHEPHNKSLQRTSITVINAALASLAATLLPAIAAAEFKR